MASPRAQWKGFLKFGELSCPVALYTAASTSDRIAFHTLNRETGNRVRRELIDSETGELVDKEDQVKGYEVSKDDYIVLEPDEVASAIPDNDKILDIKAFIPISDVDDVFFDKPYFLSPSDQMADDAFGLIRDAMKQTQVAAIAQAVLFRRLRTVLIRPHGGGLIATTLNFDYEVRPAADAFDKVPKMKIKGEMLDLAKHIITTKAGEFDPGVFNDRYEAAVVELVKAKIEGRMIAPKKERKPEKASDLMNALRQSAGMTGDGATEPKRTTKKATPRPAARRASTSRKPAAAHHRKAG